MAKGMKFACLVLACMIVVGPITANAALLSCDAVHNYLAPCIVYVIQGGVIPRGCCNGVRNLYGTAHTTADRQQICGCIQQNARRVGSVLNPGAGRAAGIPKACGVKIPYKISYSLNCKTVR
ncbi:PREDICTED: non-specific lipid-transfer protein 1-like [Camelina sativa]|uniref:Non-specific lipid-transfer protein n=1 Tax=Camelina sativa TaxID=90675 RepID=A0ABM0Z1J8_CAMSA|nr:PREDICTED: non-specific lipid-transfer protein 1-like [Camelina sativa]